MSNRSVPPPRSIRQPARGRSIAQALVRDVRQRQRAEVRALEQLLCRWRATTRRRPRCAVVAGISRRAS